MKLSVIIPVYNVAPFLDDCVASALEVDAPMEILLVDDGSTDGSAALCDAWAERNGAVRVFHQENQGLSQARNRGIRESRGEYFLFLDGDDLLDPEETGKMLGCLTSRPRVLMGLYRSFFPEEEREEAESSPGFLSLEGEVSVERFLSVIPADGQSHYMIAPRFIVRRDFLLERELFFHPGIYHEDEEWTQRLLCAADRICVTHCFFYRYRRGRNGAITAAVTPKHIRDIFLILDRAKELRRKLPEGSEQARYLSRRMAQLWLNILLHLSCLPKGERMAAIRRLQRYKRDCLPHLAGRAGRAAKTAVDLLGIGPAGRLLAALRKACGGKT